MKSLVTIAAILGLSASANAATNKIKKKAPVKASVSESAHNWLSYDIDIENTTLSNREGTDNDMTIYGELLLNLPGSIKSNLGSFTTQIGVAPELAGPNHEKYETDSLFNKYGLMYNTLAFDNPGLFSAVVALTFVDLVQADGTGSESAFYVILPTNKLEIGSPRLTLSSAPNIKFHADANTPERLAANTSLSFKATDKLSMALRNEFRYNVELSSVFDTENPQDQNGNTRNRLGPFMSVSFNKAFSFNAFAFTNLDTSSDNNRYGVNFGISGSL